MNSGIKPKEKKFSSAFFKGRSPSSHSAECESPLLRPGRKSKRRFAGTRQKEAGLPVSFCLVLFQADLKHAVRLLFPGQSDPHRTVQPLNPAVFLADGLAVVKEPDCDLSADRLTRDDADSDNRRTKGTFRFPDHIKGNRSGAGWGLILRYNGKTVLCDVKKSSGQNTEG